MLCPGVYSTTGVRWAVVSCTVEENPTSTTYSTDDDASPDQSSKSALVLAAIVLAVLVLAMGAFYFLGVGKSAPAVVVDTAVPSV